MHITVVEAYHHPTVFHAVGFFGILGGYVFVAETVDFPCQSKVCIAAAVRTTRRSVSVISKSAGDLSPGGWTDAEVEALLGVFGAISFVHEAALEVASASSIASGSGFAGSSSAALRAAPLRWAEA